MQAELDRKSKTIGELAHGDEVSVVKVHSNRVKVSVRRCRRPEFVGQA